MQTRTDHNDGPIASSHLLPELHEVADQRKKHAQHEQKLETRFAKRSSKWVERLMQRLTDCMGRLCPGLKRKRVESTTSPLEDLHVHATSSYATHWRRICTCIGVLTLLGGVLFILLLLARFDNSQYLVARNSDRLLRRCGGHTDRMRILQEPAHRVPQDAFVAPRLLPCGTPLDYVLDQLVQLHGEHPNDGHRCLTAKHLNHSYAIISLVRADNVVEFVFNPSDYNPIGTDVVAVNETSDFFPRLGAQQRLRPRQAWLTVVDNTGMKERLRKEGATLHCLLAAWEILTNEHYEFWQSIYTQQQQLPPPPQQGAQ